MEKKKKKPEQNRTEQWTFGHIEYALGLNHMS